MSTRIPLPFFLSFPAPQVPERRNVVASTRRRHRVLATRRPASGRRARRLRARLTALPSDLVLLVLAETATSPRVGYGKGLGHGEAAG